MLLREETQERRGAIIPMAAILAVALFGMVAFAVDIGWITVSQSELQNAADAAAFAGVSPLMDGYVQHSLAKDSATKATVLTTAQASAKTKAKLYASYNSAGGTKNLELKDADIEFGFLDASNVYTPAASGSATFPNTIKVVLRRDGTANEPLSLFFGPVLGNKTTTLQATASATCYTGVVNSFSQGDNPSGLLPVAYDVNHWKDFLSTGKDPDGNTSTDSNGVPKLLVYPSLNFPDNGNNSGNFGQLSLDDSHVGASERRNWIDNGVPKGDIQTLKDHGLIPLSAHNPNSAPDWCANPGFTSSMVQEVNDKYGQTYMLPLFKPVNAGTAPKYLDYQAGAGGGSGYDFTIVQFVGIKIVSNGNRDVTVQPAAVVDPNAIFEPGTVVPAGTSTGLVTTFAASKLSR